MSTLNEIADVVAAQLQQWNNYELKELLKIKAKNKRAFLIRRDIERNSISSQYLQKFRAELIQVDKLDNCVVSDGCVVLRTKHKMPFAIRLNNYSDFKFVGDLEGNVWTATELEELKYTKHNRFTSKDIRWTTINQYDYVFNNKLVKWIVKEAAWESPEHAINYCENSNCFDDNTVFPCPVDMIDAIIKELLAESLTQIQKEEPPKNE